MRKRGTRFMLAIVGPGAGALALAFVGLGCNNGKQANESAANTAALTVSAGDAGAVTQVSGYGGCTHPACADIARACDDIIRTGCGAPYIQDREGGIMPTPLCTEDFQLAVAACTEAVWTEMGDIVEAIRTEERVGDAGVNVPPRSLLASELARCTRRATTCDERIQCTRGTFIPPPPPFDAGPPFAPPPDVAPPPPDKPPFTGGPNGPSVWTGAPWQDGGLPPVELIAEVDSPSCASCAIQRCPTFAYRCFSAEADPVECPGGDCCHSFRKCVQTCGGYAANSNLTQFYACSAQCSGGRPHAAQELADLQRCAREACSGCENYDHPLQQNQGRP